MHNNGESSLLRSMAVALGEGVAFSMGSKIADRLASDVLPAGANPSGLADRMEKMERRIEGMQHPVIIPPGDGTVSFDERVITGVVGVVDARFQEYDAKVDRHIADAGARIALEIQALERRLQTLSSMAQAAGESLDGRIRKAEEAAYALRERLEDKISELRGQMVEINHEFAQAVAGIVREEVTRQLDARAAALERRLQDHVLLLVDASIALRLGSAPAGAKADAAE